MKLRYTPQARIDLQELRQYISVDLCNPSAANHVIANILQSCSNLKNQPLMGIYLKDKIERDTDLQYIISGKHLVFYRIENEYISIIRILDSRTNYLKVLL